MELISDLEKRLEEQEGGAYAIQNQLAEARFNCSSSRKRMVIS